MTFWSSQTIRERAAEGLLISPFAPDRVLHGAYELSVGDEAYVTSTQMQSTQLKETEKVVVPPGQFGMVVTKELVRVPLDAIGFISIRAGIKFEGLVNVSGFHVDPGFIGRLRFAVYNAGSHTIVLDQGQAVFMMWFADLDRADDTPYTKVFERRPLISGGDVAKLHGDVASPASLKREIHDLKGEMDKKVHALEHSNHVNRALIMLAVGLAVVFALREIASGFKGQVARVVGVDSIAGRGGAHLK